MAIRAVNDVFFSLNNRKVRGGFNKAFLICLSFDGVNAYLSDFVIVLRQGLALIL